MTSYCSRAVENLIIHARDKIGREIAGFKAQTYVVKDIVETFGPAFLKLLMGSKNIVLFHTIKVKLFLSVTKSYLFGY